MGKERRGEKRDERREDEWSKMERDGERERMRIFLRE
jgi:hypothetical protein